MWEKREEPPGRGDTRGGGVAEQGGEGVLQGSYAVTQRDTERWEESTREASLDNRQWQSHNNRGDLRRVRR